MRWWRERLGFHAEAQREERKVSRRGGEEGRDAGIAEDVALAATLLSLDRHGSCATVR